jgi:hypothetical protein
MSHDPLDDLPKSSRFTGGSASFGDELSQSSRRADIVSVEGRINSIVSAD